MKLPSNLFDTFTLTLGNFSLPITYIHAALIVFLIFLLIIVLAQFRRHLIERSFQGGIVGLFFGFLLAIILEGFLLIGGNTVITEVLGWKNAPKPISIVLDAGREKLKEMICKN